MEEKESLKGLTGSQEDSRCGKTCWTGCFCQLSLLYICILCGLCGLWSTTSNEHQSYSCSSTH